MKGHGVCSTGNVADLRPSKIHGIGVFTNIDILEGAWWYIYGTLIPLETDQGYALQYDDLTAWEPFPPFKFTNHDNDPNCVIECDGDEFFYMEALKDIKAGEELTIDYGFDPAKE